MSIPYIKVGELADQIRGVTYAKEDVEKLPIPGYLPVLRAGNITEEGLVFEDLVYVPAPRISSSQMVRQHDVIIAASSGSLDVVGKAAPALADFDGGFGAFCKVLRPNQKVHPGYFAHYFKTKDYRRLISSLAAGANINNLKNEHLDDLLVPLPPLPEQRRIAAILDQAEALRNKRRAALAKLDTLAQSIFIGMFGDTVTNPRKWPVSELGPLIQDGLQNGLYKPSNLYGTGTPILRIDGFYAGAVSDLAALKRVKLSPQEVETYGLRANEVVVNRVNSPEYLGKCALIPELAEPTVFESNMMRFSVDETRLHPRYLVIALQGASIRAQILGCAKHAINQSSINQKDVSGFRLQLPPIEHQRRFAKQVSCVEEHSLRQQHHHRRIEALFASLQHQAFRGEL